MLPTPLALGSQNLPLPSGIAAPLLSAALLKDDVVTLRFAFSSGDDVLAAPSNRLTDGDWLVRASGELFANLIVDGLTKAVSPRPAEPSSKMPPQEGGSTSSTPGPRRPASGY